MADVALVLVIVYFFQVIQNISFLKSVQASLNFLYIYSSYLIRGILLTVYWNLNISTDIRKIISVVFMNTFQVFKELFCADGQTDDNSPISRYGKELCKWRQYNIMRKSTAWRKVIIVATIKSPQILNENPKNECSIIFRILIRNVNTEFRRPHSAL